MWQWNSSFLTDLKFPFINLKPIEMDDPINEDLICDAKENDLEESSSKGQKLKDCLRSCCPLLLDR